MYLNSKEEENETKRFSYIFLAAISNGITQFERHDKSRSYSGKHMIGIGLDIS